jgi:large subunit ribosomal protein L22
MPSFRATHRHARIAATKVRPFADMIRGMTAEEALNALQYVPNRGARLLEQVLKSAMANAEFVKESRKLRSIGNVEDLPVSEARVDGGPMFKRIRPRARGMAYLERHRFSHIHVAVGDPDD